MIFKPVLLKKILDEEKTVTRRPLPCSYEVGKTYAIQPGMARESAGRIRVLDVREEMLGCVELNSEPTLEGFKSAAEFIAYWDVLYGGNDTGYDRGKMVARIEFELIEVTRTVCICCEGVGTVEVWED